MGQPKTGDDRKWRMLLNEVSKLDREYVKVGVLADQGGAAPVEGGDATMVEIAAAHEYGDPQANLPERSFIRRTFIDKAPQLAAMQRKLAGGITTGKLDTRRALDLLGAWAAGQVKLTITSGSVTPPLKQATIDRKGSSKPLIDRGQLVNSITWSVEA